MTVQTIKRMLDACYQAKRIREIASEGEENPFEDSWTQQ